jgi:hypothetical protein
MSEGDAEKTSKLFEKIQILERSGVNIKEVIESLGFDYACILPADAAKIGADGVSHEILQLRVAHHEAKRLKVLKGTINTLRLQRQESKNLGKPEIGSSRLGSYSVMDERKKEGVEARYRRIAEASQRALKLKLDQKARLLQRIKEKEFKSSEQKQKYILEAKEKIEKFQTKEKTKLEAARANFAVGFI